VTIYIPDASALIALEEACLNAGHQIDEVLEGLTDLAIAGKLLCPPLVVRECKRLGDGEPTTRWLKASSGHFGQSDDPWEYMEVVLSRCPLLLDPDDTEENPQVAVLALALYLTDIQDDDVIVITDQWVDSPIRQSLGNAAPAVLVQTRTVEQLIGVVLS
jgi:hypothetical protein